MHAHREPILATLLVGFYQRAIVWHHDRNRINGLVSFYRRVAAIEFRRVANTRLVMASVPDQEMMTLCPVAFSNTEIASETDSLAAFGAKTLRSAAIAEQATPNEVSRQVAIRASMF